MADRVRVLRVLEYEGDREWVEMTLSKGSVPMNGVKVIPEGRNIPGGSIKSAIVTPFPEIIKEVENNG